MLVIEGLTRRFGDKEAVSNVNLEIGQGAFVGVIGRSGAGKSTLLRMVNRLQDPSSGRISFDGRDVTALKGRALREWRAEAAMIFQQFNLVGRLSLFSNVMLGALGRLPGWRGFFGVWPSADKDTAMAALHRVGVSDYAAQRANTLSGGQQQRGAIARAIVQGAQAILADEPVASLDPVSARKVMELLVELNKRDGLGVIVTLHQVDYAIRYCDRVIALQKGKVVYDGPSTGLDTARLIEIYGPEFEDAFWEAKA